MTADALIAQKRAEIAAKLAAMKSAAPTPKPQTPATKSSHSPSPAPPAVDDLSRRVAEAQRRVAESQSRLAVKENPYMSLPPTGKRSKPAEPAQQGVGLKMAAHPLLLDTSTPAPQSKKDRYKPMQPKFASIKANTRNAPTPPPLPTTIPASTDAANPYTSGSATAANDKGFEGAPRERAGRSFRFNQKGKYVQIANQMRQQQQLEQLKQRIAESARKAGLDTEFETLEKNIKREVPPEAEWWDKPLLPSDSYKDLEGGVERLNLRGSSVIDHLIQHPIPIPPPGDKNKIAPKPLMLTKKEAKKRRKQMRQAELQDKRDRIRMGLIPPDPPKVRLANLMKVLTSDAVQDPTRVEARVRREVAMRKHTHEKMNAERKLTDEQRREKVENKKLEAEKSGVYGAIFKVKVLSDPAHRFKVRKNAEQLNLTGVCIFHPSFNMVYVEGASKFIRNYKRLLLHRIAWTEAARARGAEEVEIDNDEDEGGPSEKAKTSTVVTGEDGAQEVVSLEDNRCDLVWEGQLRDRTFTSFKPKTCPTDAAAREVLGTKIASYWDQAKNFKPEDEELF
ncbi:pre-mRNA processing factor 3-domain-containing protein [Thelephora terrestris]|uniref:Pre-mRNA processing factor 3-domain-containing protein n=1 Tax=Thelephora terrestris TaxID=56493 RepID=A0A9P6L9N5_9AGAM|nr:pre-mRNA processing factor 3-domain-containing protein [Thelephora terrestris]